MPNIIENDLVIEERGNTVVVLVPLYIPKVLWQNGAVETLARENKYTDKITGPEGVEIDNPDTPMVHNVRAIQSDLKEKFRVIMEKQGEEQGRKQASEQFEALFQ